MFRPAYFVLLLFAVLGFGPALSAQIAISQPDSTTDPTIKTKLEGTVINALNGDPLPRALVQLVLPVQRMVMSGPNGRFQFDDLPPGQAYVLVQKPGYYPPNGDPRFNGQGNIYALDAHTAPITLKMVPQCVITGHVEEPNGEAIEGANVRVSRMNVKAGHKRREQLQVQRTDEDGNFRMAGLSADRYYVAVEARQTSLAASDVSRPKTGFPATVYYPAVSDVSSATPIDLTAGRTVELDFSVRTEPVFDISGTVSGQPPGQNVSFFLTDKSGEQMTFPVRFNQAASTLDVRSVPPGAYILHSQASDTTGHIFTAEVPINVTKNITDARLVLEPALSIPLVVRYETTHPHPELDTLNNIRGYTPVRIILHTGDVRQPDLYVQMDPTDDPSTFMLKNIVPGKYVSELMVLNGGYLHSAKYGSTDLLREEFVVTRGAPAASIDVDLRDDFATLSVGLHVDNPLTRTMVLVTQDSAPMQPAKLSVMLGNGPAMVARLAPGEYTVFAFDSVDQMEYANPDFMAQYASKAVHVSLAPNGETKISLDIVRTGE